MKMSMDKSRKKLTILWVSMSTILCIILFGQVFYRTSEYLTTAMKWALPKIFPTLSLIIAIWIKEAINASPKADIDRFIYKLAYYLSFIYLLMLLLIFILSLLSKDKTIEIMNKSDMLINLFQGIVTASLGIFFVSDK